MLVILASLFIVLQLCPRHFPDGDARKDPEVTLGKHFTSPKKRDDPHAKRAIRRNSVKELAELRLKSPTVSPSTNRQYFPLEQVKHDDTGFVLYAVFLSFFNFLGPVVNELRY